MKNTIIYCRVSTTEQKEKGSSLGEQDKFLNEYCCNNDINIVESYSEDYSAKNFNRPKFKELFKYAKKNSNKIDYLIVHKWDRFTRNVTESYEFIDKFKSIGIEVNSMSEWLDMSIPQNKLMLALYLANPDVENQIKSERTTMGMRAKKKQGQWCASLPVGFIKSYDNDNNAKVIHDPQKAQHLKQLFIDFSTGNYKQSELLVKYIKHGLIISTSQISKMLRNRFYAGEILLKSTKNEPEEIVTGLHEPIITKAVFNNIQRVLKGRQPIIIKTSKHNDDLPLRGLLVCTNCGNKLTGSTKTKPNGKKYSYYHCSSFNKCESKSIIQANEFHQKIDGVLTQLTPNPEVKELLQMMIKDKQHNNGNTDKSKIKNLNKEINELKTTKEKLIGKFITDSIAKSDYNAYNKKIEDEIEEKYQEITKHKVQFDNLETYVNNSMYFFENLGTLYNTGSSKFKKKLMSSIVEKNIEISGKHYRTLLFNDLTRMICSDSMSVRDFENKKGHPFYKECPEVTPRRIELLLPG